MQTALKSIFAVAEAYPQLQASQNFLQLQGELVDTEDKIQASRRFYNGGVRELNTKIKVFPNTLFVARPRLHRARVLRGRRRRGDRRAAARAVLVAADAVGTACIRRHVYAIAEQAQHRLHHPAVPADHRRPRAGWRPAIVRQRLAIVDHHARRARRSTPCSSTSSPSSQALAHERRAIEIQKADNPRLYRIVENLSITDGHADAEGLHHQRPGAERLRHRARPASTPSSPRRPGCSRSWTTPSSRASWRTSSATCSNYDIRVSMIVFGLVVAVGFIADMFLRMAFFGAAQPQQQQRRRQPGRARLRPGRDDRRAAGRRARAAAVSRQREYLADATGAHDHAAPGCARQRPAEAAGLRPADAAAEHARWRTCGSPTR